MLDSALNIGRELFQDGGPVVMAIFAVSFLGWTLLVWLGLDLMGGRSSEPGQFTLESHDELLQRMEQQERVARAKSLLGVIAVLSAISPLLGLLGTVLGMMETFSFLGNEDVPRVDALAGGVSKALITTQAGLIVALTLMAGHAWLQRKANDCALRIGR